MKPQYYLTVLLLAFISISQKAEAQRIEEQLIGSWVFDYTTSLANLETSAKQHIYSMPPVRILRIENAYKERAISYQANGVYNLLLKDGRTSTGHWQLNNDKTVIELTNTKGKTQYQKIKSLNPGALISEPETTANKKMFIPAWYYTKS